MLNGCTAQRCVIVAFSAAKHRRSDRMSDAKQGESDYSMLSRRWSGITLVTSEIAAEIARLVHKASLGPESLEANEPLAVNEDKDSWIVNGTDSERFDKSIPGLVGPFRMQISKFDAQILSYVMMMDSNKLSAVKPKANNA
jgi:hypothetical protein